MMPMLPNRFTYVLNCDIEVTVLEDEAMVDEAAVLLMLIPFFSIDSDPGAAWICSRSVCVLKKTKLGSVIILA